MALPSARARATAWLRADLVVLIHEMHELGIEPVFWPAQEQAG